MSGTLPGGYADVLQDPMLATYCTGSDISPFLAYPFGNSTQGIATKHIPDLPDPDDAPFREVALPAGIPRDAPQNTVVTRSR